MFEQPKKKEITPVVSLKEWKVGLAIAWRWLVLFWIGFACGIGVTWLGGLR